MFVNHNFGLLLLFCFLESNFSLGNNIQSGFEHQLGRTIGNPSGKPTGKSTTVYTLCLLRTYVPLIN